MRRVIVAAACALAAALCAGCVKTDVLYDGEGHALPMQQYRSRWGTIVGEPADPPASPTP